MLRQRARAGRSSGLALLLICAALLGSVACQVVTGETRQPVLSSRIEALEARTPANGPLAIRYEVKNTGNAEARLLLWNTPLERVLSADLFEVVRDGKLLAYRGRLAKRVLPPGPENVMLLAPGAVAHREIDLSLVYDVSLPGLYSIRFTPRDLQPGTGKPGSSEPAFATLRAASKVLQVERY